MSAQAEKCDHRRIADFIANRLADAEVALLERHLSGCRHCGDMLRGQTASGEEWERAGRFLRDDAAEPEPSDLCDGADRGGDRSRLIQEVLGSLAPTDDPQMLGRIDGYEISGVIGCGGMGVVLKGFDRALNRVVAIKVMAPHLAAGGASRARFAREAQAAAAMAHPNVIDIYGVSESGGLPYLVMPYARGPSLQRRIDERGPLPVVEVLRIGAQIASGLAAAHGQGLVHRDIKPANILLGDGNDRLVITDFGLARAVDDASVTQTGVIAGTPQYMSPEQARGEPVDHRSDLFSLGSLLYTLCTGRPPFRAETMYGVLRRITDNEPRPIPEINAEIPAWLGSIVGKLHAKFPEDRYQSAQTVAELLQRCLAHVQNPTAVPRPDDIPPPDAPSAATAQPASRRAAAWFRNRLFQGVAMMIAILGLGTMGLLAVGLTQPPDISGKWSGEGWGHVELTPAGPGRYVGTYDDTFGGGPGEIELEWSRVEQRFNGSWREGEDRFGKVSVRLVDGNVRGAWTTSRKSQLHPGNPRLADLVWRRSADDGRSHSWPRLDVHEETGGAPGAAPGAARQVQPSQGFPRPPLPGPELAPGAARQVQPRQEVTQSASGGAELDDLAAPPVDGQVFFREPAKMSITVSREGKETVLTAPARLNFLTGESLSLNLSNIPGYEGVELFASIELAHVGNATRAYLAHNAVPIVLVREDIDQVVSGNLVTKVIYLPHPENAEVALTGVETLVSQRLDPGIDPVKEADRRGAILAVLRLGNRAAAPEDISPAQVEN